MKSSTVTSNNNISSDFKDKSRFKEKVGSSFVVFENFCVDFAEGGGDTMRGFVVSRNDTVEKFKKKSFRKIIFTKNFIYRVFLVDFL